MLSNKDDHERSNWQTLRSLIPYLWPKDQLEMRVRVMLALTLLALAKGALVYVPILYGKVVDSLTSVETSITLTLPVSLIIAYGFVRIASLVFGELRDAIFAKVGQRAVRLVALEVFQHLHRLSLSFHLGRQTGALSRSVERGTKAIELLLRFSLFNIIPTIIEITLVFIILWYVLDLKVALITLLTVIAYITYTMLITEWRIKFRRAMNEQENEASTKAIDSLLNFETVKYFNNEKLESIRFDTAMAGYETAAVKSQTTLSILNIGQALIISSGLTIVMLFTGQGIVGGIHTVGVFVMANTYLMQLYQPLNVFGFVYREIKQALIDIEKMFELLDVNVEVGDSPFAKNIVLTGGNIVFDNVSFGYSRSRKVIKDISFQIESGRSAALVGHSGSGKSTISRLLYRFYDIDRGSISIDGQPISAVTQNSLRKAIAIVPQDTVLFNDSLYHNISYGRPLACPSQIEEAARLACIHDFIMELPNGYETIVGERGLKLSGGERQRIAIARAILKTPEILVFDEATSALDSHIEKQIQKNLRKLAQGHTTLYIAHRLSTIIHVDEILVMEAGEIVERGNHNMLVAHNGIYARMWQRQLDEDDDKSV